MFYNENYLNNINSAYDKVTKSPLMRLTMAFPSSRAGASSQARANDDQVPVRWRELHTCSL